MDSFMSPVNQYRGDTGNRAYSLSSLSKMIRIFNPWQMSWQRQQILLKYFFTPQVSEMSNYYLLPSPLGLIFQGY